MTRSAPCSKSARLAPFSSATRSSLAGPRTANLMREEVSTSALLGQSRVVLPSVGMARRLSPPRHPVDFELDGERITGDKGEPLAFSLIGAGKVALCRSPKLHRPHGPYCLRGG